MNLYKSTRRAFTLLLVSFLAFSVLCAQDYEKPKKKSKSYLYLDHYKKTNGAKELKAVLKAKIDRKFVLLENHPVIFMQEIGDSSVVLATVNTNSEGEAVYKVPSDGSILTDNDGVIVYLAEFEGSKSIKAVSSDVEVMDLDLIVDFKWIDSVKTAVIRAGKISGDSTIAVNDVDVALYVQRMFSLLPIADGSIENGKLNLELPDNIPGDSIGNLQIITRIEEDKEFAYVENIQIIQWGIPVTERLSYVRTFHGGNYILFLFASLLIAGLIIVFFTRRVKKVA